MQHNFFIYFIPFLVMSCVENEFDAPQLTNCQETELVKNREINDIQASSIVVQHINIVAGTSDIIEAYVTSSDIAGNFYKTISMQSLDGNSAFSLPVEASSTFINFEPGRKVLLKMDGLYTDIKYGGLRIGSLYSNSFGGAEVGRLSASSFATTIGRSCTVVKEDQLVRKIKIANIKQDKYINRLVEIEQVQFDQNAITKTYYDANNDIGGGTNHFITDIFGNQLVFRTSSFANFAAKKVPSGSGTIRGVLTKFDTTYQLVVRSEKDLQLDKDRFVLTNPFFSEDFQNITNNTNLNIAGWTNFSERGTVLWKEKIFTDANGTNGYAECSPVGSSDALNIVWLISPSLDFTSYTNKIVTFKAAQHHLSVNSIENNLQVFVSNDFDGRNVLNATWQPLIGNIPNKSADWYAFLDSVIDLSSYVGKLHLAFKYTGSGNNTQLDGVFQIDDFKVFGK